MSFSGPTQVITHYGIFSYCEVATSYEPRRFHTSLGPHQSNTPPPMRLDDGEFVWSKEDGEELIAVRVKDQTVTVSYLSLAGLIAVTAMIFWLVAPRRGNGLLKLMPAHTAATQGSTEQRGPTHG